MSSFSYGKIIACSLIFLLLSVACGGPTGNPENGKRWFDKNNCSFCHGESGKNGKAPAIAGLKLGYGSFEKKLRKPDSTIMPSFSEQEVSRQDVADMYTWLKSVR